MNMPVQIFKYNKPFRLESGALLNEYHLAYTTLGELNETKDNVIWVFHALTANSDPSEWWSGLVGEGKLFDPKKYFICGHNIKEFDIPYICRRMLVQYMPLPKLFEIHGKKPWELEYFIDTLNLWRFGDYKAYTSLKLLCGIFGIPTPKDDIDGSEVGKTYWEMDDLQRIEVYCRKDVVATARVMLRMLLMYPMGFEVHEI